MALVNDTFTDTIGTTLSNHVPDQGGAWVTMNFSYAETTVEGSQSHIFAHRLEGVGNLNPPAYRNSAVPLSPDYDVEADFHRNGIPSEATFVGSLFGRMTPTGRSSSEVDRYEVRVGDNTSDTITTRLYKVVGGTATQLGSSAVSGSPSDFGVKLELRGTAIKVYHDTGAGWVEKISVTDSAITQIGRVGVCAPRDLNGMWVDNYFAQPQLEPKAGTDTLDVEITEASVVDILVPKTGTDTLDVEITEDPADQEILTLKTASDDLDVSVVDVAALAKFFSMTIRAGLIKDTEPALIRTRWNASDWMLFGPPGAAKSSGLVLDYIPGSDRVLPDADQIPASAFEALVVASLSDILVSPIDQRGTMRLYVNTARLSEGGVSFRGSIRTPAGTFPMTQDPLSHDIQDAVSFRRMDMGLFSWPPGTGGSGRLRTNESIRCLPSTDLTEWAILQIEAISSDGASLGQVELRGLDILPVEDGFFIMQSHKGSEQTALQEKEILVVDTIDDPAGSYVLRETEDDGGEQVCIPSTAVVAVLGSGFYLHPENANLITFLVDWWSEGDSLGEAVEEAEFDAWVEYEPRYLFF